MNGYFTAQQARHLTNKEYAHYLELGLIENTVVSLARDTLVTKLNQRVVELESTNEILEACLLDERETVVRLRRF